MNDIGYNLHVLGWQAFQDLAIAVAEECLQRPVQSFLPSNDGGRDGAFIGSWKDAKSTLSSTIQCKFTSTPNANIALSDLSDELGKVSLLAARGLADDYIILTNYFVSGRSEAKIRTAFQNAGAKTCRVFGSTWIVGQIRKSARLRMMVPRLYGLGDLSNILDERAYAQAQMILSTMGDDLRKLVVTDAHRKSVRAINDHNFVLLLGAPAAGKSTIGASLAVGATDLWNSSTIRVSTPRDLQSHLNPNERQFFWIDDAWGSTQYQRHNIDEWNKILPLIQGAIQRGSQFLLTSRDYIWKQAKNDLKTHALPLLDRSRVIINVQSLTEREKAQILYNHIKLGDQSKEFRKALIPIMPVVVGNSQFMPESARRLGSTFFTTNLAPTESDITKFFENQSEFLLQTLRNLSSDYIGAIGLVFLKGGRVRSPIEDSTELDLVTASYGVDKTSVRNALGFLEGTLTLLAEDETSRFWTFKHPTVGDAFALLLSQDPELIEIYLRGAKPELILREVVCAGVTLRGAPVRIPVRLYDLLLSRIATADIFDLQSFLSYRADKEFAGRLIRKRPDLLDRLHTFLSPINEDGDAQTLAKLFELGLLPEEHRKNFVEEAATAAVEKADASFLQDQSLRRIFNEEELEEILRKVEKDVLPNLDRYVEKLHSEWTSDYDPDAYFDELLGSISSFVEEVSWRSDHEDLLDTLKRSINHVKDELSDSYSPPEKSGTPSAKASPAKGPLADLFRDLHE